MIPRIHGKPFKDHMENALTSTATSYISQEQNYNYLLLQNVSSSKLGNYVIYMKYDVHCLWHFEKWLNYKFIVGFKVFCIFFFSRFIIAISLLWRTIYIKVHFMYTLSKTKTFYFACPVFYRVSTKALVVFAEQLGNNPFNSSKNIIYMQHHGQ